MIEFFSGEDFRFFWLPIFTTVLTIVIRIFYKDKRIGLVTWTDFSVAPNLMVTAIFIFLIKISLLALQIKNAPELSRIGMDLILSKTLVFGILLVGMTAMTWILREHGWRKYMDHIELKPKAIIISDIVGALYLIIAYNY